MRDCGHRMLCSDLVLFLLAAKACGLLCNFDFQEFVLLAPERQPGQPVFTIQALLRRLRLFDRKQARGPTELRPSDLAPHITWGNLDSGIIANALVLARVVARFHVEFAILLREPDWGWNGGAAVAKSYQRNVFLPWNVFWN